MHVLEKNAGWQFVTEILGYVFIFWPVVLCYNMATLINLSLSTFFACIICSYKIIGLLSYSCTCILRFARLPGSQVLHVFWQFLLI